MTLKMNSLITSIIVLTFFTTIIPILGNVYDSDNKAYLKLKDEDIPYETLITFRQKYETEILQFCQKNNIEITYEEAIMSASLLYFKESFEEFIMYVENGFSRSDQYIDYLLLLKDDTKDNEYKTNLEQFKNKFLEEFKILFESVTFFSLPKDIEEEYFSREFRFFCAMSVVDDFNLEDVKVNPLINYVSKKEYTQFVVHFIKELNELNSTLFPETEITIGDIKYNEESAERKIAVDKLIKIKTINFEKKWSFVDKQFDDLNVYYLIYDKIQSSEMNPDEVVFISDDGDEQTIITAFLKYFKESLDNYFKLNVYFGMDEITDENNKKLFYTRMLRTMLSIYNDVIVNVIPLSSLMENEDKKITVKNYVEKYNEITGDIKAKINVRGFVELMINRAEAILESNKNKKITVIPLSSLMENEDKKITVKNYVEKYNEITDMPEKADWKSILKHLVINRLRVNENMKNIEKE